MLVRHVKTGGLYTVIAQDVYFTKDQDLAYPQGSMTPPSFSAYLEAEPDWLFTFQNYTNPENFSGPRFIGWADAGAAILWDQPYVAYMSKKDGIIWVRPFREFWGKVIASPEDKLKGKIDHHRFTVETINPRPLVNPR